MQITIEATHFYEWFPYVDASGQALTPTEDEQKSRLFKVDAATGKWLKQCNVRIKKGDPRCEDRCVTMHQINPPASELDDFSNHFVRKFGAGKSRNQLVALYIGEHILFNHGHPEHFTKITVEGVDDAQALTDYLNAVFEVKPYEQHDHSELTPVEAVEAPPVDSETPQS